jgi:hypothetical protein
MITPLLRQAPACGLPVRNAYLEEQARESSTKVVEMCIRFGKTGQVDMDYVQEVASKLSMVL